MGNRLYIMGPRGGVTHLFAIDVRQGKQVWATPIAPEFNESQGNGPRGTPAVAGDHVFGLTCTGTLICARTSDGRESWRQTIQDFGGSTPGYGFSESVLIEGNLVICAPGGQPGTVVALETDTGKLRWQSSEITDGAHYVSMLPVNHHGGVQLAGNVLIGSDGNNSGRGFICQNFLDGKRVWHERTGLRGSAVIYANGRLYILGEHDAVVRLAEVSEEGWTIHGQFQLEPQSDHQKAGRVWTHPVIADGKLYLRNQEYLFCYDVWEH